MTKLLILLINKICKLLLAGSIYRRMQELE